MQMHIFRLFGHVVALPPVLEKSDDKKERAEFDAQYLSSICDCVQSYTEAGAVAAPSDFAKGRLDREAA